MIEVKTTNIEKKDEEEGGEKGGGGVGGGRKNRRGKKNYEQIEEYKFQAKVVRSWFRNE